jgi:hypothetical protein
MRENDKPISSGDAIQRAAFLTKNAAGDNYDFEAQQTSELGGRRRHEARTW